MEDTMRKDIEAVVAKIFSEKEESDQRKQTEDMLTQSAETIDELTTSLETKIEELRVVEVTVNEKVSEITNLNTELEAARKEITDLKNALSASEELVVNMKKDIATKERMAELESSSVVMNVEAQTEKVREMTDEAFASYRDELISLRKAVEEELAKSVEVETSTTEVEVVPVVEAAIETNVETIKLETPPANVTDDDAVAAALNLEVASDDMRSKYKRLGQALADQLK
jgi:chromosome segregation ATPase